MNNVDTLVPHTKLYINLHFFFYLRKKTLQIIKKGLLLIRDYYNLWFVAFYELIPEFKNNVPNTWLLSEKIVFVFIWLPFTICISSSFDAYSLFLSRYSDCLSIDSCLTTNQLFKKTNKSNNIKNKTHSCVLYIVGPVTAILNVNNSLFKMEVVAYFVEHWTCR